MAKKKQPSKSKFNIKRGKMNIRVGLGILAVAIIGIPLTLGLTGNQTNWFDHASGPVIPGQAITNLNSTTDTLITINPDGTMGPQTSIGNWSNSLPAFLKGNLVFSVTDPPQDGKPTDLGNQEERSTDSIHVQPTHTMPTQAQANGQEKEITPGQGQANGPQAVTSLKFTITKAEIHIAYQETLGQNGNQEPTEKPTVTTTQGQAVDHWETLNLNVPTTLDLVQLAKTNNLSALGLTKLAAGRYTEVRLYISKATATLNDGTNVTLTILGKDNIVRVVQPFTIVAGKTTSVIMAFDAQHSVVKAGSTYILKPVVARLIVQNQ